MNMHTTGHAGANSYNQPPADALPPSACILAGRRKPIVVKPDEFALWARYVHDITGIFIEPAKSYLLETRLGKLLESQGCSSFSDFLFKAKNEPSKVLEKKIIDAITTNETLFFRDISPFELLKFKLLPEIIDCKAGRTPAPMPIPLRFWSAACSTGQEIYSIAMVLKEMLPDQSKYAIQLLGTDISDAAVKQASYGIYNKFEIERGLDAGRLQRFFSLSGDNWKIRDEIRSMAMFRRLNLMEPLSNIGRFDIIFCRNVAIYFNLEDRKKLFDKIADSLEPDGYLIIGATESLTGVNPRFVPYRHLKSIFYKLH